jgi:hypothetical protein
VIVITLTVFVNDLSLEQKRMEIIAVVDVAMIPRTSNTSRLCKNDVTMVTSAALPSLTSA